MAYPVFASGDVLNASDMNAVGLWLVKSQTVGSAVSSVTVTGAFSSSYDNYFITMSGGSASGLPVIYLRLGASTTGYYNSMPYVSYAAAASLAVNASNAAYFNWAGYGGGSSYNGVQCHVFEPYNSAKFTRVSASYIAENEAGHMAGMHKVLASYTDFTLIPSTGTMTGGTIRVYGYRN